MLLLSISYRYLIIKEYYRRLNVGETHLTRHRWTFLQKHAYFRHDDLKEMLDSNKDGLKLEAMKRIIGVIV